VDFVNEPAQHTTSLYARLEALPENLVGEIINGCLHAQPRPAGPHALAASRLGADLERPYGRGRGGPGGWWIIDEPEVHFVQDQVVAVPDIGGWRKQRMPMVPRGHRFEVVPDWLCEILSPTTAAFDRTEKMPVYAQYGVRHLWLLDPAARTLEVFEIRDARWTLHAAFKGNERISAPPFQEVSITLSDLWVDAQ
jgi:Uma2 family endonuclease